MRIECFHPDDEEKRTVVVATWDGHDVTVTADGDEMRATVAHAFRRTPVAVDDAAYRRLGASGTVVLQPGDLEWFRAVAYERIPEETGLGVRSVVERVEGGYDPAANYRPFVEQMDRIDARRRG
jgi:hypothetical protein